MIHLLSHVTGSEVNDSRPVGSGHLALIGPSDCARDSDWMIPLILMHMPIFISFSFSLFLMFLYFSLFGWGSVAILFCLGVPSLKWFESP